MQVVYEQAKRVLGPGEDAHELDEREEEAILGFERVECLYGGLRPENALELGYQFEEHRGVESQRTGEGSAHPFEPMFGLA